MSWQRYKSHVIIALIYGQILMDPFCKPYGSVVWEASTSLEGMCIKATVAGVEILQDKDHVLEMKQNSKTFQCVAVCLAFFP